MTDLDWMVICILIGAIVVFTVLFGCFIETHIDDALNVYHDEHEDNAVG